MEFHPTPNGGEEVPRNSTKDAQVPENQSPIGNPIICLTIEGSTDNLEYAGEHGEPLANALASLQNTVQETRLATRQHGQQSLGAWNTEAKPNYDNLSNKGLQKSPSTIQVDDRGISDQLNAKFGDHFQFPVTNSSEDDVLPTRSTGFEFIGSAPTQSVGHVPDTNLEEDELETLDTSIREALVKSAMSKDEHFIPSGDIDRILTLENVEQELNRFPQLPSGRLAREVLNIRNSTEGKKTSRRKLFAILVLMDQPEAIVDVVEEDLYDHDLPFELDRSNPGKPVLAKYEKEGGKLRQLSFCKEWRTIHHDTFYRNQWEVLSPYFRLRVKKGPGGSGEQESQWKRYLKLRTRDILPFIEYKIVSQTDLSEVYRVKLHKDHYNYKEVSASAEGSNPYFALKVLQLDKEKHGPDKDDRSDQKEEVLPDEFRALDRLAYKESPYLIWLMGMFKQDDKLYMLFPWADGGNLLDLWKSRPDNPQAARPCEVGTWFSGQVLGLAKGLEQIHKCHIEQKKKPKGMTSSVRKQEHGIHCDIKPSNILWFEKTGVDTDSCPGGVLKISDFGFSTFRGPDSLDYISAAGVTPTYRPPEYEGVETVSQKSDVWAFGCVLLEWLTWYLQGLTGVQRFEASRDQKSYKGIIDNAFFEVTTAGHGPSQWSSTLKWSVQDHIRNLRNLPYCPEFAHELLDYITKDLLRMKPHFRTEMKDFVPKLERWHAKCQENESHAPRKIIVMNPPDRSSTTDSLQSIYDYMDRVGQPHGIRPRVMTQVNEDTMHPDEIIEEIASGEMARDEPQGGLCSGPELTRTGEATSLFLPNKSPQAVSRRTSNVSTRLSSMTRRNSAQDNGTEDHDSRLTESAASVHDKGARNDNMSSMLQVVTRDEDSKEMETFGRIWEARICRWRRRYRVLRTGWQRS